LANLAVHLHSRFSRVGRQEDFDEAIEVNLECFKLRPEGHPSRSWTLNYLADLIAKGGKGPEEFKRGLSYLSESETLLPPLHPLHGLRRFHVAKIYLRYHDHDPSQNLLLSRAFEAFANAASHPTSDLTVRLNCACTWAREARSRGHESRLHAYSVCLDLLSRMSVQVTSLDSQRKSLLSVRDSLASDAASCAIDLGDFKTAVEMLDQGRGRLWRKMRGYRHPLLQLREARPDLAEAFEALSAHLEYHAMSSASEPLDEPNPIPQSAISFDVRQREYNTLSEKWDQIVEEIRALDGFGDFLRATPFAALQQAAVEGPVIVVNVNKYRSDAIIVRHTRDPMLVALPDATPEDLADFSSHFTKSRPSRVEAFSEGVVQILKELWRVVVGPVVEQLEQLLVPAKSRIWWCPTSELCALPIHAAGPYAPKKKWLPDLYVSSYTPTLSALIQARSGMVCKNIVPKLLVIGQPDDGSIPAVEEEVRRIQTAAPSVDVLVNEDANKAATLSGLQNHSWVHFACHGRRDPEPFHSSFKLHNGESLELLDVIKARLPDAELAFVSACHGAAVDI
jgi:hypothetical protein